MESRLVCPQVTENMVPTQSSPLNARRLLLATAGLLCCAWTALSADSKPPAPPLDKDHAAKMARGLEVFKKHVRPVLVQTCLRCHGGKKTESEFDLVDRAGLLKGGSAG